MLVAGGGPAGRLMAEALALRGLRVLLVDPGGPWRPTWGIWDDPPAPGLPRTAAAGRWPDARIQTDRAIVRLPRPYLRLDTPRLQAALEARTAAAGVVERQDRVLGADLGVVHLEAGGPLRAGAWIDARGPDPEARPLGRQIAWGELLHLPDHPWDTAEVTLMDWRPAPAVDDGLPAELPSFLYALPLDRDHVFLEETILTTARPVAPPALRARLHARLHALGLRPGQPLEVESCIIPMGGALPSPGPRRLPWGAAAGMVHPATGYQLRAALTRVGPTAGAFADGWATGGPEVAVRAAWSALWSPEDRRARALFEYGAQVLERMPPAAIQRFYEAFGALPPAQIAAFLDGGPAPERLMVAMAGTFARADLPTRLRLMGRGSDARLGPLLRAVVGV